ncbi:hypothetical protein KC340_g13006 [Hortaea werneckii]|nr:hypothetical protein KC342_g13298 [Hortaea werneckii]KAI7093979.1 hypothetical protein KC339_g11864 [Hortaea werneckii]KAI7233403.1 hypothetical protein KC365_g6388 [Hortaea werneckii]KAI7301615.1 hypothetical protein KC340_g13006 [Hortaea werneckii]KAI7389745.1 hypothetical protein KC328_g8283 [Hortaea werneckii]
MGSSSGSRPDSDSDCSWRSKEYPQLDLNYEALRHIANYYLPGGHGKCMSIDKVGRGTYHEIRLLEFDDGWTCIGRFTRDLQESVTIAESEIATREHVRKHTTIPVPETYYINLDPTNAVGAPFVLMEHIEGHTLADMWPALKTDYRLAVLSDIAKVLAQLVRLCFNTIGSLKMGGVVGYMQNPTIPDHLPGRGPFVSLKDYMLSFFSDDSDRPKAVKALYPEIREEVTRFCDAREGTEILSAPYRLLHGDFDYQNMLFVWEDPATPPHLSGIIDWDYSRTVSLYDLCEYPIFIQDNDCDRKAYEENRLLREEFVRMLAQNFPKHSHERHLVRECFRYKISVLNEFNDSFTHCIYTEDLEMSLVKRYIKDLQNLMEGRKTLPAYYGRCDSPEPDSELESDDEDT